MSEKHNRKHKNKSKSSSKSRSSSRSRTNNSNNSTVKDNGAPVLTSSQHNVSCVTVPIFKSFGKNLRHYYHNRNSSNNGTSSASSRNNNSTSTIHDNKKSNKYNNSNLKIPAVVRKEQRQGNNIVSTSSSSIQHQQQAQQERDDSLLDCSPKSFNTTSYHTNIDTAARSTGSDISSKFSVNVMKHNNDNNDIPPVKSKHTNINNTQVNSIPNAMTNATAATTSDSDNGTTTTNKKQRQKQRSMSSINKNMPMKKKETIDNVGGGITTTKLKQFPSKNNDNNTSTSSSLKRNNSTQSISSAGEVSHVTVLSTISSIIDNAATASVSATNNVLLHNGTNRSSSPVVVSSTRSFDRRGDDNGKNNTSATNITTRSSSTPHPSKKLIPLNASPSYTNPHNTLNNDATSSFLSNFGFLNNFLPKGKIEILHYSIKNKNWKDVIHLLSNDLHETEKEDSIAKSNFPCLGLACSLNAPFEVIKLILLNQPNGATYHDEKLNFPLHHVCVHGTSYKALRLVLSHYPDVVSKRNVLGKTPLFVSVERGVPSKWCDLLIDTAPEVSGYNDNMGVYPLHHGVKNYNEDDTMLLKKLIATYPQAVKKLDKSGAAPLHYAVSSDCSYNVISLLLKFSPAMAKIKVAGVDCIKLLWALYESYPPIIPLSPTNTNAIDDKNNSVKTAAASSSQPQSRTPISQKKECWNKIELLLKANYHGTVADSLPDDKQWRVVHASGAYGVPFKLLKLVISMYPEQVNRADENGCYPLHLAAASPLTFNKEDGRRIDLLLSVYPEAARCSDKNNRLPLHYALENGRTWSKGIEKMLEAYPVAIGIPDPKTSFYPFMITAQNNEYKKQAQESEFFEQDIKDEVGNTFWSNLTLSRKKVLLNQKRTSEGNDDLETLYQLIRRNPILVASCAIKNVPDDMETVTLRLNNMELRRKKKSLRRALARMCADFDRVNTNHTLRTSELELEIARLTQKLSVLRIMDPVVTNSKSSSFCQQSTQQQVFDIASSADDYSESQGGGYSSSGQQTLPLKSTLKKVKDPSKKYRRIRVSFA